MNGAHDMGGMHGFGPIVVKEKDPVFHADWERRAFALTLAMGATGEWNLDMSRQAREQRPAPDYFQKAYFDIWISAVTTLMQERDLISSSDLKAGRNVTKTRPLKRVLQADAMASTLKAGGPTNRVATQEACFSVGDQVRVTQINPSTHTRLPRYVRGQSGVIERVHGCHVFADSHAIGKGEDPQWLYTVSFKGPDIWGADADPLSVIYVDAWEPYLERT